MNHVQKYINVRTRILAALPQMPPAFNRLDLAQAMNESQHFFANGIALDTFKQLQSEGFIVNASPRMWSYVPPEEPVEQIHYEDHKCDAEEKLNAHVCPHPVATPPSTPTEAIQNLWDVIVREVKAQNKHQMQSDMERQYIIKLNEKDEIIESLTQRNVELAEKLNDSFIPDLRSLKI